jgi:hypothetical protein
MKMQRRQLAKIAATSFGGGSLPPHVSILGGRFTLIDGAGNKRPLQTLHMDCVVVDINENMTRMFWGVDEQGRLKGFDAGDTNPPACFSDNGKAPSSRALEPQGKTCAPDRTGANGCKWSVWGSAISKRDGKTKIPACQNGIKTAVIAVTVQQAPTGAITSIEPADMAFTLRIPPNSIDSFKNYGKEVAGYGEVTLPWSQQKENLDLPLVVTRVSFVEGEIGKLQFKPIGYINEEIDNLIGRLDEGQVDTLIGRDDEPWDGAAIEVRPQAAPLPPPPAPSLPPPLAAAPAEATRPRGRPRRQPEAQSAPAPFPAPAQAAPANVPLANALDFAMRAQVPPFIRQGAVEEKSPKPSFGIQAAPAPNAELDNMLQAAFGLPTK